MGQASYQVTSQAELPWVRDSYLSETLKVTQCYLIVVAKVQRWKSNFNRFKVATITAKIIVRLQIMAKFPVLSCLAGSTQARRICLLKCFNPQMTTSLTSKEPLSRQIWSTSSQGSSHHRWAGSSQSRHCTISRHSANKSLKAMLTMIKSLTACQISKA